MTGKRRGAGWRLAIWVLAVGCATQGPGEPIALRFERGAGATRLVIAAAPGYRINARIAPTLERPDGRALRFTGPLTPDSEYFAEPPGLTLREGEAPVRGTLRASVCAEREGVCRAVAVPLNGER